jgi:hypothetical protein
MAHLNLLGLRPTALAPCGCRVSSGGVQRRFWKQPVSSELASGGGKTSEHAIGQADSLAIA